MPDREPIEEAPAETKPHVPDDGAGDPRVLLHEIEELKHLDETKHRLPRSSSQFREIAREIERRSRRVFRRAASGEKARDTD